MIVSSEETASSHIKDFALIRNTSTAYGSVTIALHWLMALLMFSLFAVGLYMTDLGYYDSLYHILPWWHKSIGLLVMGLLLFRIIWKVSNPKPTALPTHKPWEVTLATWIHRVLYLLIFLIGISGYLISTAKGKGIEFFDWFEVPAFLELSADATDLVGEIHFYLAWSLILLAVAHAAAALKHHFIDRDDTLKHMTFRK